MRTSTIKRKSNSDSSDSKRSRHSKPTATLWKEESDAVESDDEDDSDYEDDETAGDMMGLEGQSATPVTTSFSQSV